MQFERNLASSACSMKYSSHVGLSKELLTAKMAFPIIYEFETMILRQIFKKYSDNDILRSKINRSLVNFEAGGHMKNLWLTRWQNGLKMVSYPNKNFLMLYHS